MPQIASCPVGTEAAALDIAKAYRNSPILPKHKHYLLILWHDRVFIQHIAIEGLATAGGIQGTVANACLQILAHHNIKPVVKWVDDFIFFREPALSPSSRPNPNHPSPVQYNLSDVFMITNPLGIPWHHISKKGQDFAPHFCYIGFHWDIAAKSVSVPEDKRFQALQKLTSVINADSLYLRDIALILSTLQHLCLQRQSPCPLQHLCIPVKIPKQVCQTSPSRTSMAPSYLVVRPPFDPQCLEIT